MPREVILSSLILKQLFFNVCFSVVQRDAKGGHTVWFDISQRSLRSSRFLSRARVGLNVFNVSFYLCKPAPIHGDLTVSLNSLGDELSVLVQLKQTRRQTIDQLLLLHLAGAAE